MKLFNDTNDLQDYLPVNQGFTLENMQDDLEQAFSQFIYPRIAKLLAKLVCGEFLPVFWQVIRLD